MKIATFNVNSIRSRIEPICTWLLLHQPDILAVQETKVQDEDFPVDAFSGTSYTVIFRGQKKYNGVAIFSRSKPENVCYRLPGDTVNEAHFLQADYGPVTIINTYIPQGREMESEKFQYKLQWFDWMYDYLSERINPKSQIIWLGDLNVAREDIDVHDPRGLWGSVCFCKEVQDAFEKVMELGLTDMFRLHHKDQPDHYTFWDYRVPNGFKRNLGWRIDYIIATAALAKHCTRCEIDKTPRAAEKSSDHTVLWADFDLPL